MNDVLVTGANGFLGSELCQTLSKTRHVKAALRKKTNLQQKKNISIVDGTITKDRDWSSELDSISTIIHCAARVHILDKNKKSSLSDFHSVNFDGTLNLARQAAAANVRRFIFISTIGVNGAETFNYPYKANDTAAPHSDYAKSKHQAEVGLLKLANESSLEVVIIRPPLVYGPSAPGNFGTLIKILQSGIPLPLGAIHNRRSFVALGNLIDLIIKCIDHPAAKNQIFLVSDGEDISTSDLLRRMAKALGVPSRLFPVPPFILNILATLIGRRNMAQRLCGSLQVDIEKTQQMLGWSPPMSVDQGLKRATKGLSK